MLFRLSVVLVVLLLLVGSISAFGPRFEKGRKVSAARPRVVVNEKPNHSRRGSEVGEEISSKRMEETIHLETFLEHISSGSDESYFMFDSLRDRSDELAVETFFGDDINCTGLECDMDCDIPKEWSQIKGEVEVYNVMEFLGIRRAEPLRRPADWQ